MIIRIRQQIEEDFARFKIDDEERSGKKETMMVAAAHPQIPPRQVKGSSNPASKAASNMY